MRIRDPKTTALIFASGKMVRAAERLGLAGLSNRVATCKHALTVSARRCARAPRLRPWRSWLLASTRESFRSWASRRSSRRVRSLSALPTSLSRVAGRRSSRCRTSWPVATSSSPSAWRGWRLHMHPSQTCALRPASPGALLTHPAPRQYEPELFPGLIYRMRSPKIVLLIFVSGKARTRAWERPWRGVWLTVARRLCSLAARAAMTCTRRLRTSTRCSQSLERSSAAPRARRRSQAAPQQAPPVRWPPPDNNR